SSPGLVEAQPDFEKSINSDSGPPTCCHCGALLYGPVAEGDTIKRLCLDCRDKKVEDFINLDGRLDSIEATLDTLYDRSFTVDERLNQINERTEAGTVSILRHLDSILSLAKQARVDSVDTLKSAIITESTVSNLDCWLKPICESMASFILRTDDIVAIKHMLVVLLDRYPCESGDGCGDSYGA
ncbi:MAG: hypothetical protein KAT00_12825, partial [Planctomycetes bacterium]|nr:hypothetical protein [Planctomycetota bacterium]